MTASVVSLVSPVGLGIGSIFVAVSLIVLLAYLDLLNAADGDDDVRRMVVASVIPLFVAFSGVVLFQSLAVI